MKVLLFSFFSCLSLLAGPTIRLDGPDGYFIEASMQENSKLIAKSSIRNECVGTYLKDMVLKRLMVVFEGECQAENITIYFSDEDYRMLYAGSTVDVEFESGVYTSRVSGKARITKAQ